MDRETMKVLIADDEYWIRENLRTIIDWSSYSFVFLDPAEDGEDALCKIKSECPDILITDINMPFLSGTELISRICQDHPETVCIVLSGYSDYVLVREALVAGAMDYLLKPISAGDLLSVLSRAVDRLTSYYAERMENLTIQEKLRKASSIDLDRELSLLIHRSGDYKLQAQSRARIEEYELIFSCFTIVMFHTASLSRRLPEGQDLNKLVLAVKELIAAKTNAQNSIVFNYTYKTNVFFLITDLPEQNLLAACQELVNDIGNMTLHPVTAAISRYYYSFSAIRQAYNELQMALYGREYSEKSKVLYAGKTPDLVVSKRITAVQEKQLKLALGNCDRSLFQNVLYHDIRIQHCMGNGWTFIETRQTADSIAFMLRNAAAKTPDTSALLGMENLMESLLLAVENFNADEIVSVLEQMMDEVFTTPPVQQSDSVRERVFKVRSYINDNLAEELSLISLSRLFYVDSSYLSKTFKQVVGDNMMLYISKRRIREAQALIRQGKLSLTEISGLVGYGDYCYFNRVFHKVTGKSPREFQEEESHKNEKTI